MSPSGVEQFDQSEFPGQRGTIDTNGALLSGNRGTRESVHIKSGYWDCGLRRIEWRWGTNGRTNGEKMAKLFTHTEI